jgi:DNA-binding beta-propeller fold protein YncE
MITEVSSQVGRTVYTPDPNWPKLPIDLKLGAVSAVALDQKGRVLVLHRGKRPVLCFSAAGDFLFSFGDEQIKIGHGLRVDPHGFIWVTDIGHHQVFKFSADGQLVLQLGKKDQPGDSRDQFNQPTDVAFSSGGDIFVSDGYGNARILKFSSKGEMIQIIGQRGRNPGEFDTPHSMCLDSKDTLYVSDRSNSRIQILDTSGKFLTEWRTLPYIDGLYCAPDDTIFASTGRGNEILRMASSGIVLESYGGPRSTQSDLDQFVKPPLGRFNVAHGVAVDLHGNIYVAEVRSRRIQKLVKQRVN